MIQVDGKTKVCGLIGNPVEHTLSPMIHNTLAGFEGRNLIYVPFPVKPGRLKSAVEGAASLQLAGLNVTVPYKSEVTHCLTEMDELARRIGAVNTLVPEAHGYKGYNTDMSGLYRALLSEGISLREETVIILGAGGAARAVACMCALKNAKKVYLLNRTPEKAQKVADEINEAFSRPIITALKTADHEKIPAGKYLAIQATSVGLYPNVDQAAVEEVDFYQKIGVGYDLIYKPSHTKFMKYVEQAGGRAFHGLKMLLYQGIIAYELWNDTQISEEAAQVVYEKIKEAMEIAE